MDDELGQYVDPAAAKQPSWTDLVNNPISRNALLSFGMAALTPKWGGFGANLASAVGAGAEGAGATAHAMQQQGINTRDFEAKQADQAANRASREREAASNRTSREEISRYAADLRLQGVQERVAGMLERAQMIHGPKTDNEWKFYQEQLKEARKTIEGSISELKLDANQREQMIEARAKERLQSARAQGMFGASVGAPAGIGQNAPPSAISPAPGGTAPAVQSPASGPQGATQSRDPKADFERLFNDPGPTGQNFRRDLETPEGQQRIRTQLPHLGNEIYRYNAMKGLRPDSRYRSLGGG